MRDVVLLFSGQGAQKVGMGKDFYESSGEVREIFARADETLSFGLSKVMFEGPDEELKRTSRCQPALYLHGLVALDMLRKRVPELKPVAAAGLSLGEFTAHAAAGTFSFETGLRLVCQRGKFMEEACEATHGAMAAMLGGEEEQVVALAAAHGVTVANFNCPGQIVLSGEEAAIDAAMAGAKAKGIRRAIKLPVAGAYHSPLMASAQEKLRAELAAAELHSPKIPVLCNFAAKAVEDPAEIREMLEKQVTGSVRWTETMRRFLTGGHRLFIELGPDRALAGMLGKTDAGAKVISVGDLASLEAAASELANLEA